MPFQANFLESPTKVANLVLSSRLWGTILAIGPIPDRLDRSKAFVPAIKFVAADEVKSHKQ
jgi:hypothetical protein